MLVAIDGPAGVGKSTVTRMLAERLGFVTLNTGAIYRCVALAAERAGADFADEAALGRLAARQEIAFDFSGGGEKVLLNGEDVSLAIREPRISQLTSRISAMPEVREALLGLQRRAAEGLDAVVEGRDIGTVVFPDARAKFFLDATPEERARRRVLQLEEQGVEVDFEQTVAEIKERDHRDRNRPVAPLKAADDAVVVDTTELSIGQVIDRMARVVGERSS